MNNLAKFFVAFVFALSGGVPAIAAHPSKAAESAQHLRTERVSPHGAMEARAYAPEEASVGAKAYAPNNASDQIGLDFGIGSQR